jgi:hypothetical protein
MKSKTAAPGFFYLVIILLPIAFIWPFSLKAQDCFNMVYVKPQVKRLRLKGVDTIFYFCDNENFIHKDFIDDTYVTEHAPWYIFWQKGGVIYMQKFAKVRNFYKSGDEKYVRSDTIKLKFSPSINFIFSHNLLKEDRKIEPFVYKTERLGLQYYKRLEYPHMQYSSMEIYKDSVCNSMGFSPDWLNQYEIFYSADSTGRVTRRDTVAENLNFPYNSQNRWKGLYETVIKEIQAIDPPETAWVPDIEPAEKKQMNRQKSPARRNKK